jgi:hypothetical protein
MNRTQKIALFSLVLTPLWLAALTFLAIEVAVFKKMPEGFVPRYGPLIVLFAVIFSFLAWILKRQSPREVGSDERDELITNRAAMAAFISTWIVLPVISVIPQLILGQEGCVPAWSLPLIIFFALPVVLMVYSAAILVQYICGRNNGNK